MYDTMCSVVLPETYSGQQLLAGMTAALAALVHAVRWDKHASLAGIACRVCLHLHNIDLAVPKV